MGQPVRIMDLAQKLISLSGKGKRDVKIQITGLREGEKLHEELFYEFEEVLPTTSDKIKRTSSRLVRWPDLKSKLEDLRASLTVDGPAPIRARIKEIGPEYAPAPTASPRNIEKEKEKTRIASAD